jgi:putative transcriptional regulator
MSLAKVTGKKLTGKKAAPLRLSRVERGIIQGLTEALAYERGDTTIGRVLTARNSTAAPAPDFTADRIVRLRKTLGVSQPVFAQMLNVSVDTARGWEQGRNAPGGPAARLLELVEAHPDLVLKNVQGVRR